MDALYTVSHKKGANLVLSVTSSNIKILMQFSLLDLEKNCTCEGMNLTHLT